jgi:hypothetical protein
MRFIVPSFAGLDVQPELVLGLGNGSDCIPISPVRRHQSGPRAIRKMFVREFAAGEMVCIVADIFQDGDCSIL